MKGFCFCTDWHFMSTCAVRSGSVLEDLCNKLRFVVDYCNTNDLVLLDGGDFFDKPTVPDLVKSPIVEILKFLKNPVYTTQGNHATLFSNKDYNNKTSYGLFCSAGIFHDLDSIPGVDLGDVYLTSRIPVTPKGKPQIVVFHGFLNQEDDVNTFRFQDIQTTEQTFILLGHLHDVCEPLQFSTNVRIYRPGSVIRGVRADSQHRTPQLVHVIVDNGILKSKMVDIKSRDWREVFTTKQATVPSSQKSVTYEAIIEQIRNAQSTDLTFEQALNQVASPDVVHYALQLLEESKLVQSTVKRL